MCAPLSLFFSVLLLGTRSLEIEALGTALEVLKGLEVDLRPEGPSHRVISVVA